MNSTTQSPTPSPPILALETIPAINFALQQNHVPVIRQLTVVNTSQKDWEQVPPKFLVGLREKTLDNLQMNVEADDEEVFSEDHPIELLVYDRWKGMACCPKSRQLLL